MTDHGPREDTKPAEIAEGVYWLSFGALAGNVYFVRSGSSWMLIDTAMANRGRSIQRAAEELFGAGARPGAILLTHVHPDHSGSALELARAWDCPVYAHADELPLAVDRNLATVERFANPLDRWFILPLLRAMPRRRVEAMLKKESLVGVARALDPDGAVPGLPDWKSILTPGHSPGHVVFFRESDRVLIAGDAVLTVDAGSLRGILALARRPRTPRISEPPWYTNWDRIETRRSIAALARLEPRVLACGHGAPMTGDATAEELRAFANEKSREHGERIGRSEDRGSSQGRGQRDRGSDA
jgi:glyoxylase-like metal-dependent hydrolase (beta-lactamase superfamily II)